MCLLKHHISVFGSLCQTLLRKSYCFFVDRGASVFYTLTAESVNRIRRSGLMRERRYITAYRKPSAARIKQNMYEPTLD